MVVSGGSEASAPAVSVPPAAGDRIGRVSSVGPWPGVVGSDPPLGSPAVADQAVAEVSNAVVGLIDSLRTLLSGLPSNPLSDFISGALYLVRRTLKPVGAGVGLFGSVACVGSGDCSGQDLSGADLSGRILASLNFAGAVLNGVDFSGSDLSGADLSLAKLRQADLTDANLRDANLFGADLVGADLDGVTNFATATLTNADLSGQILLRLNLSGKDLSGTDFSGAILNGTDLSGTDLRQAGFAGAGLVGVNFSGVDLTGANLGHADLSDVIWGGTPCPDGVDCSPGGQAAAAGTGGGGVDPLLTGSLDQGLTGSDPSIATNTAFSYQDAILAGRFSELAYKWREENFAKIVEATGWQGIRVSDAALGPGGFSPAGGGYGVIGTQDGSGVQSYAFAGTRVDGGEAGDGTMQFVFAVEGSNACGLNCLLGFPSGDEEYQDWDANVRQYGWSRYYASLQPLMAEVLRRMIYFQNSGWKTQLIITGHSLGGATAMIAYADLLAPKGDLYPTGQTDVLANGKRIWDKIGDWTPATMKAVQDVTTVYTFGAPSPLIEPLKEPGGLKAAIKKIANVIDLYDYLRGIQTVRNDALPEPFRSGTAARIFQFEHQGDTIVRWTNKRDDVTGQTAYVPVTIEYADDVVATLGSRDPGYVFGIKLRPDVQQGYAGGDAEAQGTFGLSAATHGIELYNESLIRLVTWDALLANSAPVESVVGSLTSGGSGSDGRNDVFRAMVPSPADNVGKRGNDWYAPAAGYSYLIDGGSGNDLYALYYKDNLNVTIDGFYQSGTDGVIFYGMTKESDIDVQVKRTGVILDVTYTSTAGKSVTTLQIENWGRWAPTDVFSTANVDGRLTLVRLGNVMVGPVS